VVPLRAERRMRSGATTLAPAFADPTDTTELSEHPNHTANASPS
jgi:hypothetical protein